MSVAMAAFTFLNAWWISLFLTWPFAIEVQTPADKKDTDYDYSAAPRKIRWKKLVVINTIVSAFITALLALVIHNTTL